MLARNIPDTRMDDAMVLRGFALRTRESYLAAVSALALTFMTPTFHNNQSLTLA